MIDHYEDYEQSILDTAENSGRSTAILCASDNYTICCLKLLRGRLKPDGNIGLHGFDHIQTLQHLYPYLASVAYPSDAIGKAAVDLILSGESKDVMIEHTLISGESI